MAIDQGALDKSTREALGILCGLLPTMAGPVTETMQESGCEFTIVNPWNADRPLTIYTQGEELTVCFTHSHYHIADYDQGKTESELIEEMVLGVAGIISGNTRAYSVYSGDKTLGGGFIEGKSEAGLDSGFWRNADRFVVSSWEGNGDKVIERSGPTLGEA